MKTTIFAFQQKCNKNVGIYALKSDGKISWHLKAAIFNGASVPVRVQY